MFVRDYRPQAGGPVLVWIHGLGESGLCFEHVVGEPELAGRHCVIPDLPGYGRSLWPDVPGGLVDHADHLDTWLRNRGVAGCVVVGHSMGGVIGQLLAERHPARVEALIDVDGNISAGDCAYSSRAASYSREVFVDGGFQRVRDYVYRLGISDPAHRRYWASLVLADPRVFHLHSCELVELSSGEDLAGRLAALPCPTVYIAGSPGGVCPRSLELLEEAGADVRPVSPAGHWPFLDRPGEFAALVSEILGAI